MSTGARVDRARIFFALWPDSRVRETLAVAARESQAECGGHATAPDNIHMTLFFVGDIERARVARLQAVASSMRAQRFDLDISEIGYWRHNRIVWAGSGHCPSELTGLVADLRERLASEGIQGEDRPYVPHATLVRNARHAPNATCIAPFVWRAREFVLVESAPAVGGVRYDVIARWPLVAPV